MKLTAWALKNKASKELLIRNVPYDIFDSRDVARMCKEQNETVVKIQIEIKEAA